MTRGGALSPRAAPPFFMDVSEQVKSVQVIERWLKSPDNISHHKTDTPPGYKKCIMTDVRILERLIRDLRLCIDFIETVKVRGYEPIRKERKSRGKQTDGIREEAP